MKQESLWNDIRRGNRGRPHDYTSGSIGRAITLLAIPMVLEASMHGALEVFDAFFVAKLGSEAVAAIGITGVLLVLVFAVGFGLGMAASAMVSRRIGEQDTEAAAVAASQSILLGVVASIPITALGILFSEQLLSMLGASPSVAEIGAPYCAVTLASSFIVVQFFLIGAIFRGAGDAVVAMRTLWLANGLNIVLDPLLIFGIGPVSGLGLLGAAIASALARGIGLLIQLRILFRGTGRLHVTLSDMRPDWGVIRRLVRIALPGVLQRLVSTSAWLGLIRIIAVFGSSALAGYTIALRITILALLPSWGHGERGCHSGRTESGCRKGRSGRKIGLACRVQQRELPGIACNYLHLLVRTHRRNLYPGTRRDSCRFNSSSLRQLQLSLSRVRNGHSSGLQRSRGHLDAHLDQLRLQLVASGPAGLSALDLLRPGYWRMLRRRCRGVRRRSGSLSRRVPPRKMERAKDLGASCHPDSERDFAWSRSLRCFP